MLSWPFWSRELADRIACTQQSREQATSWALAYVTVTQEQRAQRRYDLAHRLWRIGRVDDLRTWFERIVAEFPATDAADRARVTLARF